MASNCSVLNQAEWIVSFDVRYCASTHLPRTFCTVTGNPLIGPVMPGKFIVAGNTNVYDPAVVRTIPPSSTGIEVIALTNEMGTGLAALTKAGWPLTSKASTAGEFDLVPGLPDPA